MELNNFERFTSNHDSNSISRDSGPAHEKDWTEVVSSGVEDVQHAQRAGEESADGNHRNEGHERAIVARTDAVAGAGRRKKQQNKSHVGQHVHLCVVDIGDAATLKYVRRLIQHGCHKPYTST